jgi:predicted  nucleic acid-binding Zn-ribbon protein
MNSRRHLPLLILILLFLLAGCAGQPDLGNTAREERRLLCEELREAEDEQERIQHQLAVLQRQLRDEQRKAEDAQQKLQGQLAERQRQLRDEQRKVEELTGKIAELEKKVAALRRIDRETLQRAIRK